MRPDATRSRRYAVATLSMAAIVIEIAMSDVRAAPLAGELAASADHITVSEVMTGGTSASDEFVELYNPGPDSRTLDGLELAYVTASGATVTRKATWGPGMEIGPGGHVLVANESGVFAGIADVTYASGLSAAGGSMALRVVGAATAIDVVGWGTASSTWLETAPAPAPPAGSSVERLPGGSLGSGQDTDQNLVDFVVRVAPDPQNSASLPVPAESAPPSPTDSPDSTPSLTASPTALPSATHEPTPTPSPTDTPSPSPTPTPSPTRTPTPTPAPLTVAAARALPDGTQVVVAGISLTDAEFHDGGGYLADGTGGIAVLVDGGTFPRGVNLVVTGTVDDRYAQRTLRATSTGLVIGSPGVEAAPSPVDSGAIGESFEGQLVEVRGAIQGSPTALASGLAFEIDDGSGPIRVLVGPATGIATDAWRTGSLLTVIGVVGQRDSSGSGTDGYRILPRDPGDVTAIIAPPTPDPTPTPAQTASPTPSGSTPSASPAAPPLVPISDARIAEDGTRLRIRGVVTLPTGLVEEGSAVVADAGGAILVRAGSDDGRLRRGEFVELYGTRSTKSGMISLRLSQRAAVIGNQAEPEATRRPTGVVREADEALLVVVRGLVKDGPRRTTGGGLTFALDDGSGPLRVFVSPRTGITIQQLPAGGWVELRGVVGQQTTGAEPNAGYRLWPRDRSDVTVIAGPAPTGPRGTTAGTARAPIPKRAPSPEPVVLTRPDLQGGISLAPHGPSVAGASASAPQVPRPIPAPLAAGLGGLAGLLVLAWRHGTIRRAVAELGVRQATMWNPMNHSDEEDESYTPAP